MRYSNAKRAEERLRAAYPTAQVRSVYDGPQGYTLVLALPEQAHTVRTHADLNRLLNRAPKAVS